MPKVLVSDKLSETAVQIFRDRGIDVDFEPNLGKDKDRLAEVIGQYDGLAIRSATKVTEKILASADNLKVVGRAGIGTDNVDKAAASKKGVIVMNTPFGNMITTAEHAIAMMFAVARQIPEASASTHAGKWEKSKFMGVELTGKTLGVIGAGNIGGIVCDRARGLKMKVVAYDPFLSEERADKMGVEKVELDALLARADFITLHVPFTDATANILSAENIAKTKKGVRIINCARGGLVDEDALAEALKSGHVAGAAFDVFKVEPATDSCATCQTWFAPHTLGLQPQRHRKTWPCKWLSKCPTTSSRGPWKTRSTCHRSRLRKPKSWALGSKWPSIWDHSWVK